MRNNYSRTLSRIASLLSHGEITFELLYTLLLPGALIVHRCPVTGETRVLRLLHSSKTKSLNGTMCYELLCEGLEEAIVDRHHATSSWSDGGHISDAVASISRARFGFAKHTLYIMVFDGVQKIDTLGAFPLQHHPDSETLTSRLITRAQRWAALCGMHHVHYHGTSFRRETMGVGDRLGRYTVNLFSQLLYGEDTEAPP